jgi:hypothetical protein
MPDEDKVEIPFLCVVTPVFDLALKSAKLLVEALQRQTFKDFIHILISNGESENIKQYVQSLDDERFIYEEYGPLPDDTKVGLFVTVVKRRDHCFKKYDAERYLCLDADIKVLRKDYFQKLYDAHEAGAKVILTQVKYQPWSKKVKSNVVIFPRLPVNRPGTIDVSNFSIPIEDAKHGYPSSYDRFIPYANDYKLYKRLESKYQGFHYLKLVMTEKDGNSFYKRLSERGCD